MPGDIVSSTPSAGANAYSGIAGLTPSNPSTQGGSAQGGGTLNLTGPATSPSTFKMTDGWYVAIACIGGVMVADTKVGPIAFGILTLALIYQLTLLLQGK